MPPEPTKPELKPVAAEPTPSTVPEATPPAAPAPAGRRAADAPVAPATAPKKRTRKSTENVVGAFLLAILVGGAIVWVENGRCPGAIRAAFLLGAPLAIPVAVVLAGLIAIADRTAGRDERLSRGLGVAPWAAVAAVAVVTGVLLVMNERGPRSISARKCLVVRRETVPARTAGVGEWVLAMRCSESMSVVRVDVDRRTWWSHESGGTVAATVAKGGLGFEWVVDTELGPPSRGFTSW